MLEWLRNTISSALFYQPTEVESDTTGGSVESDGSRESGSASSDSKTSWSSATAVGSKESLAKVSSHSAQAVSERLPSTPHHLQQASTGRQPPAEPRLYLGHSNHRVLPDILPEQQLHSPLTEKERQAIIDYQDHTYDLLNRQLRRDEPLSLELKQHKRELLSALEKCECTKPDETLYRGINLSPAQVQGLLGLEKGEQGDWIQDKAFISTSQDIEVVNLKHHIVQDPSWVEALGYYESKDGVKELEKTKAETLLLMKTHGYDASASANYTEKMDLTIDHLKQLKSGANIPVVFEILSAGGGRLIPSTDYNEKEAIFPPNSLFTFKGYDSGRGIFVLEEVAPPPADLVREQDIREQLERVVDFVATREEYDKQKAQYQAFLRDNDYVAFSESQKNSAVKV